mgnify:CR=1 FL=1
MTDLDTFLEHCIGCALWSSTDESDDSGGAPMDDNYGPEDIAPETLAKMRADCEAFMTTPEWAEAYAAGLWDLSLGGHDFWLTRNGHGAGFWDRGHGAIGDRLSAAAKAFGGVDLYVGDDGRIYA